MKCPACDNELSGMTAGDVSVDVCRGGCGGMWFDDDELPKLEYADQSAGEELLRVERNPAVTVDQSKRYHCPKCVDPIMQRHFASPQRKVTLDQCPNCNGFWLDAGELATVRAEYHGDDERRKAADAYFSEVFDDKLKQMEASDLAGLRAAASTAHAFRFICPSFYIPGKQAWGGY